MAAIPDYSDSTIFMCPKCGGNIVQISKNIGKCQYCDSLKPLPSFDSDANKRLFEQAEAHRKHNEFGDAISVLRQLITDEPENAEACWLMAICRYGIEYIKDPRSKKSLPTMHRYEHKPFKTDIYYEKALSLATPEEKEIYREDAERITKIQSSIRDLVEKEESFDVFICYKETDENGHRTKDSQIAHEIYNRLTRVDNLKVFFSHITLESRGGDQFEPLIFRALETAKVMLLVATKKEYVNSAWVKNEWNRYLDFIQREKDSAVKNMKSLYPVLCDMSPSELPPELSLHMLQAVDYRRMGALEDIEHGVLKKLETRSAKAPVFDPSSDAEYIKAREIAVKADAQTPLIAAQSYLTAARIMGGLGGYRDSAGLSTQYFEKSDECLRKIKEKELKQKYDSALGAAATAARESPEAAIAGYTKASSMFESLDNYRDSHELAKKFADKAKQIALDIDERKQKVKSKELKDKYASAEELAHSSKNKEPDRAADMMRRASDIMRELGSFSDSKSKADKYEKAADRLEALGKKQKIEKTKEARENEYDNAKDMFREAGKYTGNAAIAAYRTAANAFSKLGGYKDCAKMQKLCQHRIEKLTSGGNLFSFILSLSLSASLVFAVYALDLFSSVKSLLYDFDTPYQVAFTIAFAFVYGGIQGLLRRWGRHKAFSAFVFLLSVAAVPAYSMMFDKRLFVYSFMSEHLKYIAYYDPHMLIAAMFPALVSYSQMSARGIIIKFAGLCAVMALLAALLYAAVNINIIDKCIEFKNALRSPLNVLLLPAFAALSALAVGCICRLLKLTRLTDFAYIAAVYYAVLSNSYIFVREIEFMQAWQSTEYAKLSIMLLPSMLVFIVHSNNVKHKRKITGEAL